MHVLRIALLAVLWITAGCSSSGGASGSMNRGSDQPSQPPGASAGLLHLPTSVVDPVVAEIARDAAVAIDQVVVQSAEPVTFPDGSLGCPLPGMMYTQVQIDGYRIVAVAAGTTYDYRGSGASFRRCEKPAG